MADVPARIPDVVAPDEIGTWLSQSDANHLLRLVAWVRCEVGQSPEELVETIRRIAPHLEEPDDASKERLVTAHREAMAVPQYVRAAIKALDKTLEEFGSRPARRAQTQRRIRG